MNRRQVLALAGGAAAAGVVGVPAPAAPSALGRITGPAFFDIESHAFRDLGTNITWYIDFSMWKENGCIHSQTRNCTTGEIIEYTVIEDPYPDRVPTFLDWRDDHHDD